MWISIARIFKTGLLDFWRNLGLSLATTGIMVLTLFSISVIVVLNILAGMAVDTVQNKVDVSVFFKDSADTTQVVQLKDDVANLPNVTAVKYVSKEQALEEFRAKHQDNPMITESIEELDQNPLQASLVVKAAEPENYKDIVSFLEQRQEVSGIDKISYEDNRDVIERLGRISRMIRQAGLGLGLLFSVIAALVMYNTIRLTIFSRREEIGIMRLVGATNLFIRMPFIVVGTIYGVIAGTISLVALYSLVGVISPRIASFFGGEGQTISQYLVHNMGVMVLLVVGFGISLGIISSIIASARYLKV